MQPAFLVRFRPAGPWRFGPVSGERETTGTIGHSDLFFRAVTSAMTRLGEGVAWRDAVLNPDPPVRLSSLYPFLGRTLYAPPPMALWPPSASARVRWKSARFVPVSLVEELASGVPPREDRWEVDSRSGCLVPAGGVPPFRIAQRRAAAVDRVDMGRIDPHKTACLEFNANAGLWAVAVFASAAARQAWDGRLKAALRLLGDSGMGGERSAGWGRADAVEFQNGQFPQVLMPSSGAGQQGYWLLSAFHPADSDSVDWSRGAYQAVERRGWQTRTVRMLAEGSTILAADAPRGRAVDVSATAEPEWRVGFAVAVPLPDAVPVVADEPPAEATPCQPEPEAAPVAESAPETTEPSGVREQEPEAPSPPVEPQPEIPVPPIDPEPAVPAPSPDPEPEIPALSPDPEPEIPALSPEPAEDAQEPSA